MNIRILLNEIFQHISWFIAFFDLYNIRLIFLTDNIKYGISI